MMGLRESILPWRAALFSPRRCSVFRGKKKQRPIKWVLFLTRSRPLIDLRRASEETLQFARTWFCSCFSLPPTVLPVLFAHITLSMTLNWRVDDCKHRSRAGIASAAVQLCLVSRFCCFSSLAPAFFRRGIGAPEHAGGRERGGILFLAHKSTTSQSYKTISHTW